MADKEIRLDPTNAVIVSMADGKIIHNGVHQRCPHCGAAMLYNRDTFIITTVGAVQKFACFHCKKQYQTITLPVPADTTPEEFYEKIRKALFEED